MTHSFWMLHNNADCSWTGAVRNLNPVATQTWHKYNIIPHTQHNNNDKYVVFYAMNATTPDQVPNLKTKEKYGSQFTILVLTTAQK